jgi:predicted nuclease with TOPRIM domain
MAKNNSLPQESGPSEFPDNGQNQVQEPDEGEMMTRLAQSEAALAEKNSRLSQLEQALAERDEQINTLKQSVAELETKLTELADSRSQELASYRALVISSNPDLPEELIAGESVEEIDKSLASARALIDRVRQRLETEIAGSRIPAGAPLRTPLDLSALSPQEKIQYAMGERR